MDVEFIEKKHFLGDNFTPEEIASVETTLRLRPIRMGRFNLVAPLTIPEPRAVERQLNVLADRVYDKLGDRLRTLIM